MSAASINALPNYEYLPVIKHKTYNQRVTYHCLLIPKGDAIRILKDPYNMEILNYIETRTLCLIRISSHSRLQYKFDANTELGWWKLEIFYHQTHGNHKKCMQMLYELLKKLSMYGKTIVHSLPIKTIKRMFPVNDRIKAFLENGCIRQNPMYGGPTLEQILDQIEHINCQSDNIRIYSNFDDPSSDSNINFFTENFNLRKAPFWINAEWSMTNEKLDFISTHVMRYFLNPNKYSLLPDDMKSLNVMSTIIKIATNEVKKALLKK